MYDIINNLHQGYRETVEAIAKDMNADFIVVDIMLRDPGEFTNYWFIEFNTSPVLKLFYSCRDGGHFDAGRHLAEMINHATNPGGEPR
jgi:glutathione synthase/RimK-type ligase-like ATP-grasp enzyme